jgi:peptidoglycan/xylan/chitin deacetylase (PgdA/CDA1 family)
LFTVFAILAIGLGASIGQAQSGKYIAITIDDLPILSTTPISLDEAAVVNHRILTTLRKHGVKAVGFVNEDRLLRRGSIDAGVALLDAWLEAGMELGNHNFGHVGLWTSTLAENQDAVIKGEVLTRWITAQRGAPLRYYRHPFTQTGRDDGEKAAFESFLASRGYTVAPFTIEHDDYLFSCVYDKLLAKGDTAERAVIADEYLAHLANAVPVFEQMSTELFDRQIPQILLIHVTRLNADLLDRMLLLLRRMGYTFITLDDALRDEVYRAPTKASMQYGPSWLARWARAAGRKLSVYGQPDPGGRTAAMASRLCGQ